MDSNDGCCSKQNKSRPQSELWPPIENHVVSYSPCYSFQFHHSRLKPIKLFLGFKPNFQQPDFTRVKNSSPSLSDMVSCRSEKTSSREACLSPIIPYWSAAIALPSIQESTANSLQSPANSPRCCWDP